MTDLISRALAFATEAHEWQIRKYTHEPYIAHPIAVAEIVKTIEHDETMIAAALLHDVVEDCGVMLIELDKLFGREVTRLVDWLTDVSKPGDGPREARKAIDREHSAQAPAAAQTIKVADLIDNSRTIFQHDPNFARVYLREKEALLDVLVLADPALVTVARSQIDAAMASQSAPP